MSAPQPATSPPPKDNSATNRAAPPAQAVESPRESLLWQILRMPARLIATLVFDLKVYHREHVPNRGGVLLVANHQSYLDPVLLAVYLRRPMSFLAKSELFTNKHFGWLIRSLNAFPVKQGAGDVGAVRETVKRLRAGHILNIFPEGSRTLDGEIGPMQPGAALVVKKAGVPIVPVVIEGSWESWPKGRKFPRPCPISVMYGPAMDVSNLNGRQITELIDRTLRTMHAELRIRHRQRLEER